MFTFVLLEKIPSTRPNHKKMKNILYKLGIILGLFCVLIAPLFGGPTIDDEYDKEVGNHY